MTEMVQQTEPPPPPPPPPPASTAAATTTTKKRRRPPLSCEQCRRRKIKCDRSFPCNHCSKSGGAVSCTYAPAHTPKSRSKKPARAATAAAAAAAGAPLPPAQSSLSSPSSPSSPGRSVSLRPAAAAPRLRPTARATQIHTPDSEEFHRGSTWQPLRPSSASYSAAAAPPPAGRPLSPAVIHEQVEAKQAHRDASRSTTTVATAAAAAGGVDAQRGGNERHARRRSEYTPPPKGSTSKGRYFGQSHWMNIAASFPVELSMLKNQEHTQGELFQVLHQCKILCQKIKHSRLQPLSSLNIGKNMLPREMCDDLVHAYTSTYEGVLRVLHLPTFWKEYASYWEDPSAESNEAFVVLMQLCIVLGSSVRDRTEALRATTTRWIYEAHMWLILPPEKGRMTLTGIQIMCLLTLAKMTCGVSSDLTWTMAGSLLRTAMYMGLHRDPSHLSEMTVYKAEMRRRLWSTILELNLQYSFEAGGMPLISCDDYDTLPPADLNDEALDDGVVDDVRRRQTFSGVATQMSVPLEVFKSFPVRLGLLQYINDFRAGIDYDKTLRFNAELTRACRSFSQTMGALTRHQNGAMRDPSAAKASAVAATAAIINTFHVSLAEVTLYRCFHALHFPVLFTAFDDPRFYFSRKMCLDGALKVADLWGFSPQSARQRRAAGPTRGDSNSTFCVVSEDFERLTLYGTGLFKNVPVQAACIIALELIHDRGGGGGVGVGGSSGSGSGGGGGGALRLGASSLPTAAAGYADLRACLDAALDWTLRRMRAGEVTAKGHCFLSACVAHTEALEQGLGKTATVKLLVERATDAARVDLALLRDVARESGVLVEESLLPHQQQQQQQQQYGTGTGTGTDGGMFEDNGAAVVEALVAGWDSGGWAWDETDDWMWGGAWSQLNVPMPLDDVHQFFETPVGYPRGRNADPYPPVL